MGIPPNAANRDGGPVTAILSLIGSNGVGELTAMIATMTTTTAGATTIARHHWATL
jgi:ABC-type branched-subunit amino acid transport system ATPase component